MTDDAIQQEVIHARLLGIVQEMQNALFRTGFSTIIRESQDASCALTDPDGQVIAQHTVLPLHLGAFPACVEGVLQAYPPSDMRPGDAYLVNHPYFGGSPHANDVAVVAPVFFQDSLVGFCGSLAHKADIGGSVPGSGSGSATEIYHEGLQVPPVLFARHGRPIRELEIILRANSRAPDLLLGDIGGQLGCTRLGERRLLTLLETYGLAAVQASWQRSIHLVEQQVRARIRAWPDGTYIGQAFLDNDGVRVDQPLRVHVRISVAGERICFDFRGSDDQAAGPSNIRPPLVRAACYYVLKCLVDPELPSNAGLARVVETEFSPGTLVDPRLPAPVNTYIPTAQAVVEAVLQALGPLEAGRRIAGSGGTGALALGGSRFVQYELFGSGLGARAGRDGVSGTSVHVGNSRITPIEIVESEFPVRIERFELLPDSGGAGQWRGGLGFVREYTLLGPGRLSTRFDKHVVAAPGAEGGLPGRPGATILNSGTDHEQRLPARVGDVQLPAGTRLRLERPGGGGFGPPSARDPAAIQHDLEEGYLTPEAARRDYGY